MRGHRILSCVTIGALLCAGAGAQGGDAADAGRQGTPGGGPHSRTGGRNPGTGAGQGAVGPQSNVGHPERWGSQGRGSLIQRRLRELPGGGTPRSPGMGTGGFATGQIGTGITPAQEQAAFQAFRDRTIGAATGVYTLDEYRKRVAEWDQLAWESTGSLDAKSYRGYASTAMSGPASAIPVGYPMLPTWPFGADGLDRLFIRRAVAGGATTVNDLVFRYEYLWYRNGWEGGLMSPESICGFDPDMAVDGFLAEPASFDAMYGGINAATQAQMAAQTAITPPGSALTRADFAFAADEPEVAATLYREHLAATPDDLGARVRLAITMLETGDVAEATKEIHAIYETDPSLADVSLGVIVGGWSGPRLRAAVTKAVTHANRTGEASAWMTVALLMEAEARPELAGKMLERAKGAGLDPVLSSRLAAMIGRERP